MNVEQRFDLRQPRGRTQMAEVNRIEPDGTCTFGDDDRLERALLNAVLGERAVLRQQVIFVAALLGAAFFASGALADTAPPNGTNTSPYPPPVCTRGTDATKSG